MNANLRASAGILFCIGVILCLESGCARWVNGNAGEKGTQSGRGQQGVDLDVSLEQRQRKAAEDMPSLSQFQRSDTFALGRHSGEERIPNDLVVVSPSLPSGNGGGQYGDGLSPQERQRGERLAALAGLETTDCISLPRDIVRSPIFFTSRFFNRVFPATSKGLGAFCV